jgi:hypothetical protein
MSSENLRFLAPDDPKRQLAVFGADALEQTLASPDVALPLVNAVRALVAESEAQDRELGIQHLAFYRDEDSPAGLRAEYTTEKQWTSASRAFGQCIGTYGEPQLLICFNPRGEAGFGSTAMDRGLVSLSPLAEETRNIRVKGLPKGKYVFTESIYVERETGEPILQGTLTAANRLLNLRYGAGLYAVKRASENDIDRTLVLLAHIVIQEEQKQNALRLSNT